MASPDFSARLDRIEDKLDRLSEALISLVRMEERLITVFNRQERYDVDHAALSLRVAELEKITVGRGSFFRWMDRAGMAAVGAAMAIVLKYFTGGE